jgi:hypothetical protein
LQKPAKLNGCTATIEREPSCDGETEHDETSGQRHAQSKGIGDQDASGFSRATDL